MDVNGPGYVPSLAQALTTGYLAQITWWIEDIVIAVILSTEVGRENWFLLLPLGFELCSNDFYALIFFCFLFFDSVTAECRVPIVEVSEAGLRNFLEHKKKGGVLSHWAGANCKQFLYWWVHISQKSGQLLSLFLSPPPTWVSSVDDHKVEQVSFSSVGAVMDLVFLALDQGLAKVS